MRTINRALAIGVLVLPLTFGAAGLASADTQSAPENGTGPGVVEGNGGHGDEQDNENDDLLGGLLNDILGGFDDQTDEGQHQDEQDNGDRGVRGDSDDGPGHYQGTGSEDGRYVLY